MPAMTLPLILKPCDDAAEFAAVLAQHGLSFTPYPEVAEQSKPVDERRNPALALLDTPYTTDWLEEYFSRQANASVRLGILEAHNSLVTDDWGLAACSDTGFVATSMSGFGWTQDQYDYMAREGHLACRNNGTLILDTRARKTVTLEGTAALLSFPGVYTYGHWITDICGRLELLAACHDLAALDHILLPKSAWWMEPFLAAYGVPLDRIRVLDKIQLYAPERLLIPTTLSQHHRGALPVDFAARVFSRLTQISRTWGGPPRWRKPKAHVPVTYVAHTALTSAAGRELANEAELVKVVESLDGRVLDPLKMAMPAFLNRLRETDLVVGLDSSALHNLAMVPTDLLVIQTERRFNMLHASIQEATGKRVGFIGAKPAENGWVVAPGRLKTLIEQALDRKPHTANHR